MNYIYVSTQFEGFHKYPDAPNGVEFLKHRHRHIFYLKIYIEVFHNERDIEFILFKRYINSLVQDNDFNNLSCESIADKLYKVINNDYPKRRIKIDISEDNENGVYKEYE